MPPKHAWAEIQHKLAYKRESHIPSQFKRKLNRISAKLEEADEQFEEIRTEVTDYKEDVVKQAYSTADISAELNLDSLQAFLDTKFPVLQKNIELTADLLDDFLKYGISFQELKGSYTEIEPFLTEIGNDIFKDKPIGWFQVGAARSVMDIANSKFCEGRGLPEEVRERGKEVEKENLH